MTKKLWTIENLETVDLKSVKAALASAGLLELDKALIDEIDEGCSAAQVASGQTAAAAGDVVRAWTSSNPLFIRDASNLMTGLQVRAGCLVHIWTQYYIETRKFTHCSEPFDRQLPSPVVEELWTRPAYSDFQEGQFSWRRAGNEKIVDCHSCNSRGSVRCPKCGGAKLVSQRCSACKGSGTIIWHDPIIGRSGGKGAGGVIIRKEQCLRCRASGTVEVECPECSGNGLVMCEKCQGKGRLWLFDKIECSSKVADNHLVLSPFHPIKQEWIASHEKAFDITYQDVISGQGEEALIREFPNTRPLLEKYRIRVLSVCEIEFDFKGKKRRLYVLDQKVHSPSSAYLYDKRKTTLILVAGLIVVILIVGGIYRRHLKIEANEIAYANLVATKHCEVANSLSESGDCSAAVSSLLLINIGMPSLTDSTAAQLNGSIVSCLACMQAHNDFSSVTQLSDKFAAAAIITESTRTALDSLRAISAKSLNHRKSTKLPATKSK